MLRVTALVAAAMLVATGSAAPSQLLVREASNVRLSVSARGVATLSYTAHGVRRHVIAWGARDALAPKQARPQVRFRVDYTGGWGAFGQPVWRARNVCRPYRGPELAWLVAACTAPDGSFWAVQRWQRLTPMRASAGSSELHLSHWTGSPASLEIRVDSRPDGDVLFGRYSYRGMPVHGFRATSRGQPLDPYGRNIYVDTYDSLYGTGWHRENGFLARRPAGLFCYVLDGAEGKGTRYRATAVGPGVTPIVSWVGRPEPGAGLGLTGLLADAVGLCG